MMCPLLLVFQPLPATTVRQISQLQISQLHLTPTPTPAWPQNEFIHFLFIPTIWLEQIVSGHGNATVAEGCSLGRSTGAQLIMFSGANTGWRHKNNHFEKHFAQTQNFKVSHETDLPGRECRQVQVCASMGQSAGSFFLQEKSLKLLNSDSRATILAREAIRHIVSLWAEARQQCFADKHCAKTRNKQTPVVREMRKATSGCKRCGHTGHIPANQGSFPLSTPSRNHPWPSPFPEIDVQFPVNMTKLHPVFCTKFRRTLTFFIVAVTPSLWVFRRQVLPPDQHSQIGRKIFFRVTSLQPLEHRAKASLEAGNLPSTRAGTASTWKDEGPLFESRV